VTPVVARIRQDDIAVAFEVEPATYTTIARHGAKR